MSDAAVHARLLSQNERIADAIERIADALETLATVAQNVTIPHSEQGQSIAVYNTKD